MRTVNLVTRDELLSENLAKLINIRFTMFLERFCDDLNLDRRDCLETARNILCQGEIPQEGDVLLSGEKPDLSPFDL